MTCKHSLIEPAGDSRSPRPLGEVLFARLFWIAAAAAAVSFALYLTSDTARQRVAPEVFLGARP